jgi:hypothetical protein
VRARPVVALSATVALLGGGSALGAVGDPADGPAAGAATSSLTLLDVGLGGKSLSVLELALSSDTLAGKPATSFVVTPLTVDGTAYGRQSLSGRSAALPAVDTTTLAPAALSALAAARSPLVDVSVEGGSSRAGTTSLGSISVLGMPLTLEGNASISSLVDGAGAAGSKTLTVTELALPSVADLVAALGLDLTKLPTGSLTGLLDGLDLTSPVVAQAQAVLDQALAPVQPQVRAAQSAVAQATAQVDAAVAQVTAATTALVPAATALNDATKALNAGTGATSGLLRRGNLIGLDPVTTVIAPVVAPVTAVAAPVAPVTTAVAPVVPSLPNPVTEPVTAPVTDLVTDVVTPVVAPVVGTVDSTLGTVTGPVLAPVVETLPQLPAVLPLPTLPAVLPVSLQPVADAYAAAKKTYDDALKTLTDAKLSLTTATDLLKNAQTTLATLLAPYQAQVQALVGAVVGVLDATPLLSLDRLEVTTRSTVTSAAAGGQTAEIVGGEVQGLKVLGTDVLDSALGSSTVEVLDLLGPVKSKVDTAISSATGTLSSVLSQVPGLPALEVPAPRVDLLTRATVTELVDGFGVAGTALRAVNVTWPGITVPAVAALPGAASLPAVAGLPALGSLPAVGSLRRGSLVNAAGDVLSSPLSLGVATLQDTARFRPAQLSLQPGTGAPVTGAPTTGTPTTGTPTTGTPTTGTPTTGTPTTGTPTTGTPTTGVPTGPTITPVGQELPRTGTDSAPSALALLLVAAALGLHRRYRTA